jgi:hypothetical protein
MESSYASELAFNANRERLWKRGRVELFFERP